MIRGYGRVLGLRRRLLLVAMRWMGTDVSEVDAPIVDVSARVTPRFQIGASIPRIVGSADPSGAVGGIGTSYISGKIALLAGGPAGVKLAVTPTVEILGEGTLQALAPGESRTQFGLPVGVEVEQGAARVFVSGGFFTRGIRFAGGGVGTIVRPNATSTAVSGVRSSCDTVERKSSFDRLAVSASALARCAVS